MRIEMDKTKCITFESVFDKMISVHGTPELPEEDIEDWEKDTDPLPLGRILAEAISDAIPNDYNTFAGGSGTVLWPRHHIHCSSRKCCFGR